jgi:hypothetical protein
MKISLQRYGIILGSTLVVAVLEKFLLELLRAPYRPPYDMGSLLGGRDEFAAVIHVASILAVVWVVLVIGTVIVLQYTIQEMLLLTGLVAVVLTILVYSIENPSHPVNPWPWQLPGWRN